MRVSLLLFLSVLVKVSFAAQVAFSNWDAEKPFDSAHRRSSNAALGVWHPGDSHPHSSRVHRERCTGQWTISCIGELEVGTSGDLSVVPKAQLAYLHTCVGALLNVTAFYPSTKIKALRNIIQIAAYSSAELAELNSALVQYLEFRSSRFALTPPDANAENAIAHANVDIHWLSKVDIYVLHTLIDALNKGTTDLDTKAKKEALGWCTALVPLSLKKMEKIFATIDVSSKAGDIAADTHSAPTTPTSLVKVPLNLKTNLKSRIEALMAKARFITRARLRPILRLCRVWVDGDLALLTSLGVKGLEDSFIFKQIVTSLGECGYVDIIEVLRNEFSEAGIMID